MRPEESTRSPGGPLARGRSSGNAGSNPFENRRFRQSGGRAFAKGRAKRPGVGGQGTFTRRQKGQSAFARPLRVPNGTACIAAGVTGQFGVGGRVFGARVELATVGLKVRCSTTELSMEHITGVEPVASGVHSRRSTVKLHARLSDPPEQHPYMSGQGLIMRVAKNGRTVDVCASMVTGDELILRERVPMQPAISREAMFVANVIQYVVFLSLLPRVPAVALGGDFGWFEAVSVKNRKPQSPRPLAPGRRRRQTPGQIVFPPCEDLWPTNSPGF